MDQVNNGKEYQENTKSSKTSVLPNDGLVDNWQASKRTTKECLLFLFNNEKLPDIHFIVGIDNNHQQRIPAHKFMLSIRSVVFEAMFFGTLATKADEIEIPDVEPTAFVAFLKFIYLDEVQICQETVLSTLYMANKYEVPVLENHCVDFLKSNLNCSNAFLLLTQSNFFEKPQLAKLCLDMIDKNTADALAADCFIDIDLNTLIAVLERNTLRIGELALFQAIVRWTEAECIRKELLVTPENKRSVLGQAFKLIRYPLISIEEFSSGPALSGLLTDREIVEIILYLTINPKPSVRFSNVSRDYATGKEHKVSRFLQCSRPHCQIWNYNKHKSDCIQFMVDQRILIMGFGLYGSDHSAKYDVHLQLKRSTTNILCGTNQISFNCDGSSNTFRAMFKEPIEIIPNTNYTASVTLKKDICYIFNYLFSVQRIVRKLLLIFNKTCVTTLIGGPNSHFGYRGRSKITIDGTADSCVSFQFSNAQSFPEEDNSTSVEKGQIPEIIFIFA